MSGPRGAAPEEPAHDDRDDHGPARSLGPLPARPGVPPGDGVRRALLLLSLVLFWLLDSVDFAALAFPALVGLGAWSASPLLYGLNARVELTPDSLVVRDWLGRRRRLPRYGIAAVTRVSFRPADEDGNREVT
ncbi:hypothetical protein [Nocardiopsis sp. FR6]|uniref:hypothetical protein n=1 Tax=Nocardiopsis sp. FR6 TaxID=2605986 RepID=UPI00135CD350|nr:hypothetical protein [Nocardiopsis sp. FR6]